MKLEELKPTVTPGEQALLNEEAEYWHGLHEQALLNGCTEEEAALLGTPMYEMANLFPATTGLPTPVWFGEVGGRHGPRIKISNNPGKFTNGDAFVMSVAKEPEVLTPSSVKLKSPQLDDIKDWVKLNYDTLMKLWVVYETGDGDVPSLLSQLEKI